MPVRSAPAQREPVDREHDPLPPGPAEPRRPNVPVEEPPPDPSSQPDGYGDPENEDERGEQINPPVQEPPREPNEPVRGAIGEDTERI